MSTRASQDRARSRMMKTPKRGMKMAITPPRRAKKKSLRPILGSSAISTSCGSRPPAAHIQEPSKAKEGEPEEEEREDRAEGVGQAETRERAATRDDGNASSHQAEGPCEAEGDEKTQEQSGHGPGPSLASLLVPEEEESEKTEHREDYEEQENGLDDDETDPLNHERCPHGNRAGNETPATRNPPELGDRVDALAEIGHFHPGRKNRSRGLGLSQCGE